MRALTLFRAFGWLGVTVVFWSLNLRWGADPNLPNGPPAPWERAIVGAFVLGLMAALALSVSGRKGNPPSWLARGIGGVAALGVLVIAFVLRQSALAKGFGSNYLGGHGWTWLMCGGGLLLGAVVGSFGLTKPEDKNQPQGETSKRKRRRGR